MPKVVGPPESVAAIGVVACRIRRFAEAVQQAHEFGLGPGTASEPWTVEFQRQAVPVYASALPWDYLVGLAGGFENAADLMVTVAGPKTAALEWSRMQQYLRSAAKAIFEKAPSETAPLLRRAEDLDPVTPPVMPFDKIARLIDCEGAEQLRLTGAAIERCCGDIDDCPLTDQELEWMRRMLLGDRSIDIAHDAGYSERSFYRALSELWDRLDVDNRNEAIALAVDRGWMRYDS